MIPASPLRTWQGRTVRGPHENEASVAQRVRDQLSTLGNRLGGSLFFVPSPLEGWGLEVLAEHLGEGSIIVCFEKSEELDFAFRSVVNLRLEPWRHRLFWLEQDNEDSVRDLFRVLPRHQFRRVEWFPLNGGWLTAPARYREICARLDREIQTFWSNRLTSMHLGPLWVRNLFQNLSNNDVSAPWPDWQNDDVVVCGAGTSLEDWLPYVKANRGSLRLLAADTALPALIGAGVSPDAVVCLEAQQVNLRDFLPAAMQQIDLFCDLSAHPATVRALRGSTYWFCTPFEDLSIWERLAKSGPVTTLPPMGSVGVAAVAIAHRLTRGRVYLCGLDFSWPQGKTHARGSPPLSQLLTRGGRLSGFEQALNWQREGVLAGSSPGWYTTRVLSSYSDVLRNLAQVQHGRTKVLGLRGLDLGLERVSETPALAGRSPTSVNSELTASTNPWTPEEERELLTTTISLIEDLNRFPSDGARWSILEAQLGKVDYLFFSFPDPQIRRESSFLSRVLILARWMRDRLVVVAGLEN